MKCNNGITLISLIITVVVMVILAGITVTVSTDLIEKSIQSKEMSNIRLVQTKVKTLGDTSAFNNDLSILVGTKLYDDSTWNDNLDFVFTDNIEMLKTSLNISDNYLADFYYIDERNLNELTLSSALDKNPNKNKYLVNYKTFEVVYLNGMHINGITFYKLSDIVMALNTNALYINKAAE